MDEVTVKGLLALGGTVLMFGAPVAWLKVVDSFQEWKARRAPVSRRIAIIDWLDPDLRRN